MIVDKWFLVAIGVFWSPVLSKCYLLLLLSILYTSMLCLSESNKPNVSGGLWGIPIATVIAVTAFVLSDTVWVSLAILSGFPEVGGDSKLFEVFRLRPFLIVLYSYLYIQCKNSQSVRTLDPATRPPHPVPASSVPAAGGVLEPLGTLLS